MLEKKVLKTCPFCGGGFKHIAEDRVNKYGNPYSVDYFLHENDDCILTQMDGCYVIPNDEEMIEKWNTRNEKE